MTDGKTTTKTERGAPRAKRRRLRGKKLLAVSAVFGAAGVLESCYLSFEANPVVVERDRGVAAAEDAGADAGREAGVDAGRGPDAGQDAGTDGGGIIVSFPDFAVVANLVVPPPEPVDGGR
ncbi:MAG: hypothetical protein ACFCGT_04995 [Sandaracinaceae bacterium]